MSITTAALLTKEEACVFLKISAPTLDRWMRAGKVIPIGHGRPVRFSKENLLVALSESATPKTSR